MPCPPQKNLPTSSRHWKLLRKKPSSKMKLLSVSSKVQAELTSSILFACYTHSQDNHDQMEALSQSKTDHPFQVLAELRLTTQAYQIQTL